MLYIVGTPIGNLLDLSYRQAKTISSADIILTEDTRSIYILKKEIQTIFHFIPNKNQQIVSYFKENEFEKLPYVLNKLQKRNEVVLISESGMPLISDPGYVLLQKVKEQKLPYTVIPGPSSITTAIVHSGFKPDSFVFMGFLPKKTNDRLKQIKMGLLISKNLHGGPVIFFESPHRINETLKQICEIAPETNLCICRELTKKFEEILTGSASEFLNYPFKGEIVLIISNKNNKCK